MTQKDKRPVYAHENTRVYFFVTYSIVLVCERVCLCRILRSLPAERNIIIIAIAACNLCVRSYFSLAWIIVSRYLSSHTILVLNTPPVPRETAAHVYDGGKVIASLLRSVCSFFF